VHVVVTGASSGIGWALAREFGGAPDTQLTLIARRRELLEKLAAEIDAPCLVHAHDLADPERAIEWIEEAEHAYGPIDVMVNNAGVENTGPAVEADVAGARKLLDLNLVTPLLIARALLPKMIDRGAGTLVNIASVASVAAVQYQAWYGASKAGLAMFSEVARAEVKPAGVHIVTVYPGPIHTPMSDAAYAVFGGRKGVAALLPEGKPEVLARLVRRAVARRKKRVVYPAFYVLARHFPAFARWLNDVTPLPPARPRE
jgi:short-subunit dehydrogenase